MVHEPLAACMHYVTRASPASFRLLKPLFAAKLIDHTSRFGRALNDLVLGGTISCSSQPSSLHCSCGHLLGDLAGMQSMSIGLIISSHATQYGQTHFDRQEEDQDRRIDSHCDASDRKKVSDYSRQDAYVDMERRQRIE